MKVRVFQNIDGTVAVLRLNPRLTDVTLDGETAKNPSLQGLPFADVEDSTLPSDRQNRHKWRVKNGNVIVDPTVPDPPDPKKEVKDRIAAANTIEELKAALKDFV